jgi:WD40 repeat protein
METTDKSTVLLASGGRDGLIHVFDGSSSVGTKKDRYSLVSTLPVHSSAVSIVKFTPDGRKLISCGMSDRTMVFSSVTVDDESKAVAKLKSVPTPEGTINGLAIDATNKYVITSGLGKRLNIWAISSGRQARSYHLENAVGELFRSDIDPSGDKYRIDTLLINVSFNSVLFV